MKVYIPFNSNDFNSIFTTLSISPCSFYSKRKYSFKRATTTYLNGNEDFLIGYEKPIFHNQELDIDCGVPVLIELEIEKTESNWNSTSSGLKYLIIDNTVYLHCNKFKLIFRIEKERNETFAKSLKSIETKFVNVAMQNSILANGDCFTSENPIIKHSSVNTNINSLTFYNERKLNRLFGAILGSSIAHANLISKEWQDISVQFRLLNNYLSLFLNKVGNAYEYEKKQVLEIIEKIQKIYETDQKLEEAILVGLDSSINSEALYSLKQSKIFNVSAFNLLIEGLLVTKNVELPLSLKLEKLKRAINSKFSSKYPDNYIERVNNLFSDVRNKIDNEISLSRKNNKLTVASLVNVVFKNDGIELKIPKGLSKDEKKYFLQILNFFIKKDDISDLEVFFTNRKNILTELAIHLKNTIDDFSGSKEREYIATLLNSFVSVRLSTCFIISENY